MVDQGPWRWVYKATLVGLHEEPLVDSLVDDNHSDVGLAKLVVALVNGFSELGNFSLEDLSSHSAANTISKED